MSFSKALKRTFTTKPGKKDIAVPHEYVIATPTQHTPDSNSSAISLPISSSSNSVGSGDSLDLIYLRLNGWKHFVKSYIDYFENIAKAQKNMVDSYKSAADSIKTPVQESYLFIPADTVGLLNSSNEIYSYILDQSRSFAQSGLNLSENTIKALYLLRDEIKTKSKEYSSRVTVVYESLKKTHETLDSLKSNLEKAIEVSKIENEAPKAGDPYLINIQIKRVILQIVDLENNMYNAVQGEIAKLEAWEPVFLSRFNNILSSYLSWESNEYEKSSLTSKNVNKAIASIQTNSEWDSFKTKYNHLISNPQNCNGNSLPSDHKYPYMDHKMLKILKAGKLSREEFGLGNSNKFRPCQAIITQAGFLHFIDDSTGIKKVDPNVTIYLPSALLAPLESPDLPRSAFLLYTSKNASKTTSRTSSISNKSKYMFKGADYEDMKSWWLVINSFTKDSATDQILFDYDPADEIETMAKLSVEPKPQPKAITATPQTQHAAIEPAQIPTAPSKPLMLTGTPSVTYGQTTQTIAYYPVKQADGQLVYIPLIQNPSVEEPIDASATHTPAPAQNLNNNAMVPANNQQFFQGYNPNPQQQQQFMQPGAYQPYPAYYPQQQQQQQPQMYQNMQPQMYPAYQPQQQQQQQFPNGPAMYPNMPQNPAYFQQAPNAFNPAFPQQQVPAQPATPFPAPVQSAAPVAAPVQTEAPVAAPAQVVTPVAAPAQTEAPVAAPAQADAPVAAPAQDDVSTSSPIQKTSVDTLTAQPIQHTETPSPKTVDVADSPSATA
ncbi:Cytoskeletal signaling protein slm1 [Smittium culicis]|uniref:Cytoskeletal signaling protein slm1 n=1 Tax=Smittium culicis TaxID=133412 RepID=A0A1R1YP05_9FUNG|nr:Cytoskeletal signaling protein slm1 [Smittium culicis]